MKTPKEIVNGLDKKLINKELVSIAESCDNDIKKYRLMRDEATADVRYVNSSIKEMGLSFSFYYALSNTRIENPDPFVDGEFIHYETEHIDYYLVWDNINKVLRYSSYRFVDLEDHEFDKNGDSIRIKRKSGKGVNCTCKSVILINAKKDIVIENSKFLPEFFKKLAEHFKDKTDKENIYDKSPGYGDEYPREIWFFNPDSKTLLSKTP